jgi:putative glycosyltransferase (TIGR04372 family)
MPLKGSSPIIKIIQRYKSIWSGITFMLFSAGLIKSVSVPTGQQVDDIKESGFIGKTQTLDTNYLYKQSLLANELHADGHYHEASKIHRDLLESVYEANKIEDSFWTPQFLSYYFGAFLGHRAFTGIVLAAQDTGIIKKTKRTLPFAGNVNGEQLEIIFKNRKDIEFIRSDLGLKFLEGPLNWHLSERLWMIKTNVGFMETQDFVDKTFSRIEELGIESIFQIDPNYEDKAQQELEKIGLPSGREFIAIHVRKKDWNEFDIRQAQIQNYSNSVKELIDQGFYVVQIGTDPQTTILESERLIAVQGNNNMARFLTPYVLAKSKFLINTSSGPSYLAALYGTPVLQTNVVAFGKSSPTLSRDSIHLPKTWIYKGKKLSLFELLSKPQGYSYRHINVLNRKGFNVVENSSAEIYAATLDILNMTRKKKIEKFKSNQVNEIRLNLNSPCNGQIAPSYLQENQSWFLSN